MNNAFVDRIKVMSLAQLFMKNYSYQEVLIKNVEGIFLQNKGAYFQIIRISNTKFNDMAAFNDDLARINKIVAEYAKISVTENPRCLCIYFGGTVEQQVNNVYSIVLNKQEDLTNSAIFNQEFPYIKEAYNLNNFMQAETFVNTKTNDNSANTNNKSGGFKVYDFGLPLKRPMFTIIASVLFVLANFFLVQNNATANTFLYDYPIYTPFITQLHQFSRLLTGLFINQSFITVFIVVYYFFIYNTLIEIRLGLKKTIILYVLGILGILISMVFVAQGTAYSGSFPLMSLVTGAYIGILLLPTEKNFVFMNIIRNLPMIALYLLIVFINPETIIVNSLALALGAMLVIALDTEKMNIKKPYFIGVIVALVLMAGSYFIPGQTLARNRAYETSYVEYLKTVNTSEAQNVAHKLDNYYHSLGVIDYDK